MRLKFIGADGSLNLRHGKIYDVEIHSTNYQIVAVIKNENTMRWREIVCPYGSPQALAKNWSL